MTQGTITTTVTFDDLIQSYDDELDTLRDAHDEVQDLIASDESDDLSDAERVALAQQGQLFNKSAQEVQKRLNVLGLLQDEFDDAPFEIKMLTGQESIDIETQLRMKASRNDMDPEVFQAERKGLVVDLGTVDAPEDVPRDEDESPTPSGCPNPLVFSLYEQVELLNKAGTTDFRAPGFESEGDSPASVLSDAPISSTSPTVLPTTDGESQPSGDASSMKPTPD